VVILDAGCWTPVCSSSGSISKSLSGSGFGFYRHSPAWPENPVRLPPVVPGNFTAACQRGRRFRDRDRSFFDTDSDSDFDG
jgi:hypothetical protein